MLKVETLLKEVQKAAKSRRHQLGLFKQKTNEPMLSNVDPALVLL